MKGGFILGLGIAVFGILVSLLASNWQAAFVISATAAGISVVISSTIRNFSLIQKRKARVRGKDAGKYKGAADDNEYWIKVFGIFALPNIIVAIILYFILYR
jgi:membrane protein implicated in regulation of membrane protease activity